jgi:hypothetical protein
MYFSVLEFSFPYRTERERGKGFYRPLSRLKCVVPLNIKLNDWWMELPCGAFQTPWMSGEMKFKSMCGREGFVSSD